MKLPKLIMVGIDHSPASMAALKEAERLAQHYGAILYVVDVLDQRLLDDHQWDYPTLREDIVAARQVRLDQVVKEHLTDAVESRSELRVGHPFVELVRSANDRQADLLVLGSRGLSSIRWSSVGSVAKKCIRKAAMPVMLVRRSQVGPFRRIVACVDFSDTSRLAAQHAAKIAKAENAALEFVHVCVARSIVDTGFGSLEPIAPVITHEKILVADRNELDRFVGELGESLDGIEWSSSVIEGHRVGTTIADYLESTGTDLAVIGTRGRTWLKALLIGTNAESLIEESPCSVLAIKPPGFSYEIDEEQPCI